MRCLMRSARSAARPLAAGLDHQPQRRVLAEAMPPRADRDDAAHLGRERADDLAERRGEDVDAADDQHVVGAADAANPRRGAAAGAAAGPQPDMVAAPEAEERHGLLGEMRVDELALGAVGERHGRPGVGVDQLEMDQAAAAEMHAALLGAFAPQRGRDVADPHRLGDRRAPRFLELLPHRRLAAAGLAGDEQLRDARRACVDAALARPLGEVERIGRGQRHGVRLEEPDRGHQPFGIAAADRDVRDAEETEGVEGDAGDERTGAIGGDQAVATPDAAGGIGARRDAGPVDDVVGGERDVARRSSGAARREDADGVAERDTEMRADRLVVTSRLADLVLLRRRQRSDAVEAADCLGRIEAGLAELAAIEARPLEEPRDLPSIENVIDRRLRLEGQRLDLGIEHQASPPPS